MIIKQLIKRCRTLILNSSLPRLSVSAFLQCEVDLQTFALQASQTPSGKLASDELVRENSCHLRVKSYNIREDGTQMVQNKYPQTTATRFDWYAQTRGANFLVSINLFFLHYINISIYYKSIISQANIPFSKLFFVDLDFFHILTRIVKKSQAQLQKEKKNSKATFSIRGEFTCFCWQ